MVNPYAIYRFKIGEKVKRRGPLGIDGPDGEVVDRHKTPQGHEMLTVKFPSHTETFLWDNYLSVTNGER